MSVGAVESAGLAPMATPRLDAVTAPKGPAATGTSGEFGRLVVDGLDRLSSVQGHSDDLAIKAATGDLGAIHQYTVAATEAQVTTQLTVAVRNKALEAFNEIMRMPL